jgi:hypothetical protein
MPIVRALKASSTPGQEVEDILVEDASWFCDVLILRTKATNMPISCD